MVPHEIGGYLEFERFAGEPFHGGAEALNSGRACLEYLIELRGICSIWLPDWLCASVSDVCLKHGVKMRTYRIGADMRPAYDFEMSSCEYLYLVDYYGQLDGSDIEDALAYCDGRLIIDESQGFFRPPWESADTLYTCRKFFGVADGGYLYTRDGARLHRELPRDESHVHMGFVLGRFERPAKEFFAESKANNARFADEPVKVMSPITENIMRAIDYGRARRIREENWGYLHGRLGGANLLDLTAPNGPFMYPLLVSDPDGARESLSRKGIYIPVLWPNVTEGQPTASWASHFSRNILPLPIDQRYGVEDMEMLITEVLRCLNLESWSGETYPR